MKPALLVVDVQKAFFERDPVTIRSLEGAIEYINAAIALFRERGLPVVCVQQVEAEDGLVPGATGFEVPGHVDVLDSDVHIHKTWGMTPTRPPNTSHGRSGLMPNRGGP